MQGMWPMSRQSSPFFEYLRLRSEQFLMKSIETVEGSPSLGRNEWSLRHSVNLSSLREVRFWRPRETRDFRFWILSLERCVRVVGRSGKPCLTENETTSGNRPPILSPVREVSLWRLQSDWGDLRFGNLQSEVMWSWDSNRPPERTSDLDTSVYINFERMRGSAWDEIGTPNSHIFQIPVGKQTNDGQFRISKYSRRRAAAIPICQYSIR